MLLKPLLDDGDVIVRKRGIVDLQRSTNEDLALGRSHARQFGK